MTLTLEWPGAQTRKLTPSAPSASAPTEKRRRLTAVVTSDYADVPAATRARAVDAVLTRQRNLPTQWFTITEVANELGLSPQALRTWVRRAEQGAGRADDDVASSRGDAVD